MSSQIVSMDLGSNSFRVLKYDCKNHKNIGEYHEIVGLADGLVNTGYISKEAQNRVVNAIVKSQNQLNYEAKNVVAVTTAAMRKAKNKQEVLEFFEKQTGVKFHIINGEEEARLTLLSIKYALKREKIDASKFFLLDIGGGSTELIVSIDDKFYAKSFDFGIVTMAQEFTNINDVKKQLENKKYEIEEFLNSLEIEDIENFSFVATAGTPTTIAAIKQGQNYLSYDKDCINGTIVCRDDLIYCLNLFYSLSKEDLEKLVGKRKIEFVSVGIYIYEIFFGILNKNESIVFDDGLREGVAINSCLNLICKD